MGLPLSARAACVATIRRSWNANRHPAPGPQSSATSRLWLLPPAGPARLAGVVDAWPVRPRPRRAACSATSRSSPAGTRCTSTTATSAPAPSRPRQPVLLRPRLPGRLPQDAGLRRRQPAGRVVPDPGRRRLPPGGLQGRPGRPAACWCRCCCGRGARRRAVAGRGRPGHRPRAAGLVGPSLRATPSTPATSICCWPRWPLLAQFGLLLRFDRAPGFGAWLGLLVDRLPRLVRPPAASSAVLLPLVLVYYLTVGARHRLGWHLALLAGLAGALAGNAFWLRDWVAYWWIRSPLEASGPLLAHRTFQTLWAAPAVGRADRPGAGRAAARRADWSARPCSTSAPPRRRPAARPGGAGLPGPGAGGDRLGAAGPLRHVTPADAGAALRRRARRPRRGRRGAADVPTDRRPAARGRRRRLPAGRRCAGRPRRRPGAGPPLRRDLAARAGHRAGAAGRGR